MCDARVRYVRVCVCVCVCVFSQCYACMSLHTFMYVHVVGTCWSWWQYAVRFVHTMCTSIVTCTYVRTYVHRCVWRMMMWCVICAACDNVQGTVLSACEERQNRQTYVCKEREERERERERTACMVSPQGVVHTYVRNVHHSHTNVASVYAYTAEIMHFFRFPH